jgi:hypothetical protein
MNYAHTLALGQDVLPWPLPMLMHSRESKAARRGSLRVKLDQDRCLLTHDPCIMAWFHHHHVRRDKVEGAAIGIRALDVATGQKADVRMHAERGAHEGLQVGGPAKARRIDEALQAAVRCRNAFEGEAAQLLVGGTCDGGKQGIDGFLPSTREGLLLEVGSTVRGNNARCQEALFRSRT